MTGNEVSEPRGSSAYISSDTDQVLRYKGDFCAFTNVFVGRGSSIHDVIPSEFLDQKEKILYYPSTLRRQGQAPKAG